MCSYFYQCCLKGNAVAGLITIITPIIIGFVFGAEPLGGYMAGVCVSGVMWAIFQNNAGGAWDNAKKSFEAGIEINGKMEYKGSEAHKAAVTGDTVGDPFKDTSGPSMNILIKLTCLVGLVIAPVLGGHSNENVTMEVITVNSIGEQDRTSIDKRVFVEWNVKNDSATAKVTTLTIENGKETNREENEFSGLESDVRKRVEKLQNQ